MMGMRMAWSGACDECGTVVHLYAGEDVEQEEQDFVSDTWPEEGSCYVEDCEGTVNWNGNDPLSFVVSRRLL